jgi:hypothetical protein
VEQAFYEFTYWTLEYLLYLKEHYPAHYKSIADNTGYRAAFRYIYGNFKELVDAVIPKNIKSVLDKLNSMGIQTREDDNWIWFGGRGIGKPTKDIEMLKNEMSAGKYVNMLKEWLS